MKAHPVYRPDIDGLRAFAVMVVVVFHAFPGLLKGGFVGVDVFFVISGYLISGIIFKSLDAGKFSFADFYSRRVRRIFPTLILVLFVSFIVGWFSLMAVEFKSFGKHVVASIAFMQNIILFQEAGYFDTASEMKPLLHLWSLGIEEQFYLFFPVLALLLWKVRGGPLYALVVIALLSLGYSINEVAHEPSSAFYLPFGRAWELLLGTFLAYANLYNKFVVSDVLKKVGVASSLSDRTVAIARNACAILGVVMLTTSVMVIDKSKSFPGVWAFLPTLGAALFILSGPHAWLNRVVFSSRVFVWIGLISYPLYLWHWPALTFLKIICTDAPTPMMVIGVLLLSFLLAWATYLFIEKPIRFWVSPRVSCVALLVLGVLMGAVGFIVFAKDGLPSRMPEREKFAQSFDNSLPDWAYVARNGLRQKYRLDCDFFDFENYRNGHPTNDPVDSISESCYTPKTPTSVMIWGDSHAQQLYHGLRKTLPDDISVLQVATSGCMAYIPNSDYPRAKNCEKSNALALTVIKESRPAVVIIAQFAGLDKSNDLKALAALLKSYGVGDLIVVGPVPRYDRPLYQLVVRKYWASTPRRIATNLVPDVLEVDQALKKAYGEGQGGFDYLSARDVFCNVQGCLTYLGADRTVGLVTFDYGHFTSIASTFFSRRALAPLVLSKLHRPFDEQRVDPENATD